MIEKDCIWCWSFGKKHCRKHATAEPAEVLVVRSFWVEYKWYCVAFFLLEMADFFLTVYGIKVFGIEGEVNPFARFLFNKSLFWMFLVKVLGSLLILFWLRAMYNAKFASRFFPRVADWFNCHLQKIVNYSFYFLIGLNIVVVVNNVVQVVL